MKYEVRITSAFKKDYKRAVKRGLDISRLQKTVELLSDGLPLPPNMRDHALGNNWAGHRECHLAPDWLLIYYVNESVLVLELARTGSHSDLFD